MPPPGRVERLRLGWIEAVATARMGPMVTQAEELHVFADPAESRLGRVAGSDLDGGAAVGRSA